MSEPATPHRLVAVHGTGRIPDGREVPQPRRPEPPSIPLRQLLPGLLCAAVVLVLTVAGIIGRLR